ncbi:MAG TPA: hypothetical protein VN495_01385, partial [Candidatus Paceibacterota bacterium]|nr:hypothetical protein [Candidatus Paceibacterota bacterium]
MKMSPDVYVSEILCRLPECSMREQVLEAVIGNPNGLDLTWRERAVEVTKLCVEEGHDAFEPEMVSWIIVFQALIIRYRMHSDDLLGLVQETLRPNNFNWNYMYPIVITGALRAGRWLDVHCVRPGSIDHWVCPGRIG